jgi:hypothetical protein
MAARDVSVMPAPGIGETVVADAAHRPDQPLASAVTEVDPDPHTEAVTGGWWNPPARCCIAEWYSISSHSRGLQSWDD